jgi:hypothetical protein
MRGTFFLIVLGCLLSPSVGFAQTSRLGDFLESDRGLVGGAELALFTLYGKQGAGGNSNNGNLDDYFTEHFAPGGRYWFGYETESGLGMRGRFFHWSDQESYVNLIREQSFQTFDLEATLDTSIHSFQIEGFAGLRWGEIELDGSDFAEPNEYQFDGLGLTIGADGRQSLIGNFDLLVGCRYSMLYGENTFSAVPNVLDNTMLDIFEVRIGTQWSKTFCGGGRLFAGVSWEQQIYGTDSYLPNAIDPETLGEVSLAGPVFTIGFDR